MKFTRGARDWNATEITRCERAWIARVASQIYGVQQLSLSLAGEEETLLANFSCPLIIADFSANV